MLNTAFGDRQEQLTDAHSICGFDSELVNAFAQNLVLDLFIALPAGDPVASSPSDLDQAILSICITAVLTNTR